MFWNKISNEVKELGKEIISYYSETEVKEDTGYYSKWTYYYFRGLIVFKQEEEKKFTVSASLINLNYKEIKHLQKCFTSASLKKLTFMENKNN
ncbi:MAG: hypothetical protein OQK82_05640 [Candidatus Pacearchaeota archaeon]|nr:hypothetical protein [Candidatus Pacearchaeota archaeon]